MNPVEARIRHSLGIPAAATSSGYALPRIRGQWFYVDPTSGSDTYGGSINAPVASLAAAYALCTSGAGDGIAVFSAGTTTAGTTSYLTSAIAWSKWGITVVGICAPTRFSQRARIANKATTGEALATLITLSGSNNAFYNLSLYNGGTTGAGCVTVSGDRNYFENVHMMGGMGMTVPTVDDFSLLLDGGDENTFVNCTLGNDTFDKGDLAGAELHVDNGAMRNRFIGCEFISFRSAGTTAAMVKLIGAGDSITRTMLFDNCFFHMYRDGNVTAEATVVIGTAPNNGFIIFKDCVRHGFTDWGAVAATGRVYSASKANAEASGITVAANPS